MYDMATIIPAVLFGIMAIVLLVWYPLSKKKVAELQVLKEEHLRTAFESNSIAIENTEGIEKSVCTDSACDCACGDDIENCENRENCANCDERAEEHTDTP